jgi:hypothetical protein
LVLAALLCAGCGGEGESAPVPVPERPVQTGDILEMYPFNDTGSFELGDFSPSILGVVGGTYRIAAAGNAGVLWGQTRVGTSWSDAVVEVRARFEAGPADASLGVMCRADPRGSGRGYLFAITPAGHFFILRGQESYFAVLLEGDAPPGILGGRDDTIRGVCLDRYLAMYANGVFLGAVEDRTYSSGVVGLAAAPGAGGEPVTADFDDLMVLQAWFSD